MENRLAATSPIVDTTNIVPPKPAAPDLSVATPVKEDAKPIGIAPGSLESQIASGQIDEADLRLVIEEDKGAYIYKTINRLTGETLTQYPREDIVKMREATDYTVGKVVNAKV